MTYTDGISEVAAVAYDGSNYTELETVLSEVGIGGYSRIDSDGKTVIMAAGHEPVQLLVGDYLMASDGKISAVDCETFNRTYTPV